MQKASGMASNGDHIVIRSEDNTKELDRIGWGSAVAPESDVAEPHEATESLHRKTFADTLPASDVEPEAEPEETADAVETLSPLVDDPETEEEPPTSIYSEDELSAVIDTNDNSADFYSAPPDRQSTNTDPPDIEEEVEDEKNTDDDEVVPEIPVDPDGYFIIFSPVLITELLPDPKSPVTDAEGEFVELFNPNSVEVDLTGLTLQMGSTFSSKQSLDAITLKPGELLALYSGQTKVSLTNKGSSARIVLPSGGVWGPTISYPKAKAGESYAFSTAYGAGLYCLHLARPTCTESQSQLLNLSVQKRKLLRLVKKQVTA